MPTRPNRWIGAAQLTCRRRVDRHHRDAAQPFIVLVPERATAKEVALVPQIGAERKMGVLEASASSGLKSGASGGRTNSTRVC
jgi:hypothetical protein